MHHPLKRRDVISLRLYNKEEIASLSSYYSLYIK